MRVLVTGADGFIGSHLVETLVRSGNDVRAFVYYNSQGSWGWLDTLPSDVKSAIDVLAGDVRDYDRLHQAMDACKAVLHLAALIGIPYSYYSPRSYVDTNVQGTLNVLQAARAKSVEKVIQTSTSEVYGSAQFVPITENHPLQAQSPYAATKIAADQMALAFHAAFDVPVTIIRPFNTYGPRQSARAVIPTIILQILDGRKGLKLGNLDPTRDFSFVEDTVAAFVASLDSGTSTDGKVINVGSGFEISIRETAKIIAQMMQKDVAFSIEPERSRSTKSEVDRLWASNQLAQEILGWSPEFGGLDGFKRGIEKTIAWFSEAKNRAHYKLEDYTL